MNVAPMDGGLVRMSGNSESASANGLAADATPVRMSARSESANLDVEAWVAEQVRCP